MKSSFKKIQKTSSISQKAQFGHPDLDAIFHNSLTKGHMMIIQQDHPTTNYLSLLRYYISANYHKKIPSLIYDTTPQKWKYLISPILKKQKKQANNILNNNNKNTTDTTSTNKNSTNTNNKNNNNKSEIAWRYDDMNINLNQLVISDDIDFIDLSKSIQQKSIQQNLLSCHGYPSNITLEQFYHKIQQNFINIMQSQKDTKPKKLLLSSLPSYFYNNHQQFLEFLNALHCFTRTSHITTLITVPPIISQQVRNKLLLYSDYYMKIQKISQGYQDFSSLLTIFKEVQVCQLKSKYRGITTWGIKNKKKEIRIQSLYQQAVQDDQPNSKGNNKDEEEETMNQQDQGGSKKNMKKKEKKDQSIDF